MDNPQLLYAEAVQMHQAGQLKEAEVRYRKLLKPFPKLEPLQTNLGAVLVAQGKMQEGVKFLHAALKINSKSIDALINLAGVGMAQGDFETAFNLLLQAGEIEPGRPDLLYNKGNALANLGRLEEAKQAYQASIDKAPMQPQAHFNLGHMQRMLGFPGAALFAFKEAARLEPRFAEAHVNAGHLLDDDGRPQEALESYMKATQANPEYAEAYQSQARLLLEMRRNLEAEQALEQALKLAPKDAECHNLMGNLHKAQGKVEEALMAYEHALSLDSENEGYRQNYQRLLSLQVPAWHFTMLADQHRNDAFQAAIERAVKPGDLVLDIGTGSGLLAMMAVRGGAEEVVACEMVHVIAKAALQVVADNGYADQITVLAKKSTELAVGNDLPRKANVLVSEILDLGLLGEGVLPTFRHAHAELLEPDAKIIPQSAKVYAQLIALPARRKVNPVAQISGFDLSAFDQFRAQGEYTRVDLDKETWSPLSDVFPVLDLDFRNVPAAITDSEPLTTKLSATASASGTVHAVAFWFDLQLDDALTVSTDPSGQLKHWGQAVYFLDSDNDVQAGERVDLNMTRTDTWIRFSW